MYSLGKERVLARLGRAGVIGYASGGFRACGSASARQLLILATKDDSDRLLEKGETHAGRTEGQLLYGA
jgi:hypothetical protein